VLGGRYNRLGDGGFDTMSRRQLRRLLWVATGLALLVSGGEAAEQAVSGESLTEVRAQVRAYELAWNSQGLG
jgi:hypothetical protein